MQPDPIIYVIDDDDAVRQSLEFLLQDRRHHGARLTSRPRPS